MIGKIARIVTDRGYGFIRSDGKDYFFHRSGCFEFNKFKEEDEVSFEEAKSPKGPRAENVFLVEN